MKASQIKLNNIRSILHRVGELDHDVQSQLFDIDEQITESIHYELSRIEVGILDLIAELEVDNTVK